MRVLVAPQELKGTLRATQAAEAMRRGVLRARPAWTVECVPLADGGPGTLEVLAQGISFDLKETQVHDPLGRLVPASFGLTRKKAALIEMARASGLGRVGPEERDAERASSAGTGDLIRAALEAGAGELELFAGGSATSDGGAGALGALGYSFRDAEGTDLAPGGAALARLETVEASQVHPRLNHVALRIWVDVQNPLLGPNGAARVYAAQKGADPLAVERLERGLTRWAEVAGATTGRPGLQELGGAGAAGGLAFGLAAFAGARLVPGFEEVACRLGLESKVRAADFVLTAEGRLDAQTPFGKGPAELARRARAASKRIICFAGQQDGQEGAALFDEVFVLSKEGQVPSPQQAAADLERVTFEWASR